MGEAGIAIIGKEGSSYSKRLGGENVSPSYRHQAGQSHGADYLVPDAMDQGWRWPAFPKSACKVCHVMM